MMRSREIFPSGRGTLHGISRRCCRYARIETRRTASRRILPMTLFREVTDALGLSILFEDVEETLTSDAAGE